MKKYAIMVGLGNYYGDNPTGFDSLAYAYSNINSFTKKLSSASWTVYPCILDSDATKGAVIEYLQEKISLLSDGDWLLFYFSGHGNKVPVDGSWDNPIMYLVTASPNLGTNAGQDPELYVTDRDYAEIVCGFQKKSKNGHLISILDCCYSFGLIDNFNDQLGFHSVFASADIGHLSYSHSDNSIFFEVLENVWDDNSFSAMKDDLVNLTNDTFDNCQVQVATKFSTLSF